jgi:outer membrane protein assembly factor BamB
MGRGRAVAGWLPAVLVVPAALAALVQASAPSDSDQEAMSAVLPLDPGTTWVYAVADHGRPSGHRVRQILGPSQLFAGTLRTGVRISSVYDNYPGTGPRSIDTYVGVEGRDLLQYGVIGPGGELALDPPAPGYRLPAQRGTSWHYHGKLGPNTDLDFTTEVSDEGDVDVGGHTFTGCTQWTTRRQVPDAEKGAVEVLTEWTCPGIGEVQSHDVYEGGDVDITEELVAFHGVSEEWTAEPASTDPPPLGGESAEGVDQTRSRAVPSATLTDTLSWSDSRSRVSTFSPVSDGQVEVVGEPDGLISAQDVRTGETRWQIGLPPPIVASPAIGGGLIFVADGAKNLWALSAHDGSAQWVHHFYDVVSTVPAVGEDAVAVAVDDGTVAALARTNGAQLWSASLGGRATTAPALAGNHLVVGDDSGALTSFDLSNGHIQWSTSLEEGLEQGPAVSGSHVLVADGAGVVTSFDLEDGAVQWEGRGRDFPSEPLAAGSGRVVTVGGDGWVEGYDLGTGERTWSREVGQIDTAPILVGNRAVVVTASGAVHVLDLARGTSVETWTLPRPDDGATLDVQAPMGVVGDSLVITAQVEAAHFTATSYAYRLGDTAGPPGVSFRAQARGFPLSPVAPAVVDGPDTYALALDHVLYRDSGDGPVPLLRDITPAVGFAAAEGVVVIPKGKEVWAVRGSDGKKLWALPLGDAYVESVPAIAGDTAYVPVRGVGLAAVGLRDGKPRWVVPTPGATGSTTPLPLPGGDVVYAAEGLARYDGRTGAEVWRLGGDLAGAVALSGLAEDHGTVYAILIATDAAGIEHDHLVAVDEKDGSLRWQRDLQGSAFGIPPSAADGTVVVFDGSNRALVLDADSGVIRWTYQLATQPGGAATVSDGVVTLVQRGRTEDLKQRDYRVTAHDAATGAFLASYQPPEANSGTLPAAGPGPGGVTLVPTTGADGAYIVALEAVRG